MCACVLRGCVLQLGSNAGKRSYTHSPSTSQICHLLDSTALHAALQGAVTSSLLCSMYLAHLEAHQLLPVMPPSRAARWTFQRHPRKNEGNARSGGAATLGPGLGGAGGRASEQQVQGGAQCKRARGAGAGLCASEQEAQDMSRGLHAGAASTWVDQGRCQSRGAGHSLRGSSEAAATPPPPTTTSTTPAQGCHIPAPPIHGSSESTPVPVAAGDVWAVAPQGVALLRGAGAAAGEAVAAAARAAAPAGGSLCGGEPPGKAGTTRHASFKLCAGMLGTAPTPACATRVPCPVPDGSTGGADALGDGGAVSGGEQGAGGAGAGQVDSVLASMQGPGLGQPAASKCACCVVCAPAGWWLAQASLLHGAKRGALRGMACDPGCSCPLGGRHFLCLGAPRV